MFIIYLRRKLLKKRRYLHAWKEFMRIIKINIDFVQVNSAMPSVLSIPFPPNFMEFTKVFHFINADFLSFTGATSVDGVNFMTRFGMMSLLPLFALLMGVAVYLKGKTKHNKTDDAALKRTVHEMFVMIDDAWESFFQDRLTMRRAKRQRPMTLRALSWETACCHLHLPSPLARACALQRRPCPPTRHP